MNVALIPARGGSKRIPRKNVRPFGGRPIIEYSIEAALESGLFKHVIVSTDDEEIAVISERAGAEVPFSRPVELAEDDVGTNRVLQHALSWCAENLGECQNACCIQATAPFLSKQIIQAAYNVLTSKPNTQLVFTAATFPSSIFRSFHIGNDGFARMIWPEHEKKRSQELPEAIFDAGMLYWGRFDSFFRGEGFFPPHAAAMLLPRHIVHDIDTEEDWRAAELAFSAIRNDRIAILDNSRMDTSATDDQ